MNICKNSRNRPNPVPSRNDGKIPTDFNKNKEHFNNW